MSDAFVTRCQHCDTHVSDCECIVPEFELVREVDRDDWRKARKKPVEVEFRGPYTDPEVVETIEGDFEVDVEYIDEHGGYVIIRGVDGEVYPCALDIFAESYELVIGDEA